ncbi:MAG: YheC/YheD family protein [Bacillota bacterium]
MEAPLIGVMLGPADAEQLDVRSRYRCMARQARAAGASILFFHLGGVEDAGRRVRGWVEQDGEFHPTVMELPEVIYNRAAYGDRKQSRTARRLLRTLTARRHTRLINEVNAFSKRAVYEALRFFPDTAHLAPETLPLTRVDELAAMLPRHGVVFAKGDHSSHGSDVVRLRQAGDGVLLRGRIGSARVDERFGSEDEVFSFLQMLDPQMDWVLQQGIALPAIDDRVFDCRVIAQKDGSGQWQLPLVLVRLAQAGSVAANMSQGAVPFLPADFARLFNDQVPGLKCLEESVSRAARLTLHALESRFGLLGEVGIDIGLDQNGSAWVFEANTKPLHPAVPGLAEEHLLRYPFEYGLFLANQARAGRRSGSASPFTRADLPKQNACP